MRTQSSPVELSPLGIQSFTRALRGCLVERDRRNHAALATARLLVDVLAHPGPEADRARVASDGARTINATRSGMRGSLAKRASHQSVHLPIGRPRRNRTLLLSFGGSFVALTAA